MLPSLKRNNKLFINNYVHDFQTMLIMVEYYDYALKGVNRKIAEDLQKDIVKENINPFFKTLTLFLKDVLISSQIFETEVKKLVYNSQFSNAYSQLENFLVDICNDPEGVKTVKANNELQRSIRYLKGKIDLDSSEFNQLYQKIDYYREIRNAIVHMNIKHKKGNIKKENLDNRLKTTDAEIYINDSSYIVDFLNTSIEFILFIIKEVEKSDSKK